MTGFIFFDARGCVRSVYRYRLHCEYHTTQLYTRLQQGAIRSSSSGRFERMKGLLAGRQRMIPFQRDEYNRVQLISWSLLLLKLLPLDGALKHVFNAPALNLRVHRISSYRACYNPRCHISSLRLSENSNPIYTLNTEIWCLIPAFSRPNTVRMYGALITTQSSSSFVCRSRNFPCCCSLILQI